MAQPATMSRLRSETAPVVMLDFLLILPLILFLFLPSPHRMCRDVLWAGLTSLFSHQLQDQALSAPLRLCLLFPCVILP